MFSRRVPSNLAPNAIARRRSEGPPVPFDLTVSNPTACGLLHDPVLLRALGDPRGLVYAPDPKGLAEARRTVARAYRERGLDVDEDHIALASSTSEAYAYLFKLLCDPGDEVRIPAPSYPLLDHLASLEGVVARPYRLDMDDGWRPQMDGRRARAVVAVHPNNPTGSYLDEESVAQIGDVCRSEGAALIVDEVFLDFPLDLERTPRSLAGSDRCLTFVLGGLSKSVGLPQLKLSWIVASGPRELVDVALERLEFVADHYLSVATPVQLALPEILARGGPVRDAIRERCAANLLALRRIVESVPSVRAPRVEGGWSALLRVPAPGGEERLVLDLLSDGVAVHPGYFFDFPREGFLVLSLLPEPHVFEAGVERIVRRVESA